MNECIYCGGTGVLTVVGFEVRTFAGRLVTIVEDDKGFEYETWCHGCPMGENWKELGLL